MAVRRSETRRLSDRELQVLTAYATGLTKAEVGQFLHLSENTIKTHLKRISEQLGTQSVTHAVFLASQNGWLEPVEIPDSIKQRAKNRPPRARLTYTAQPIPSDLGLRYASTAWGEAEWVAVLKADNHLYFSLLRGIGRAGYRRDNPDRLRAAAIPVIPLPRAAQSDYPRAPASSPVPSG